MKNPDSSLIARFSASDGRLARAAILEQKLVQNHQDVAGRLYEHGQLEEFHSGQVVLQQGELSNDIYFILFGEVSISINGRETGIRRAGEHIGEMAAITPSQSRAATVTARTATLCLRVEEQPFSELADDYPIIWRRVAMHLAKRLEERNQLIACPNPVPVVFLISSSEAVAIADAIRTSLSSSEIIVKGWNEGTFGASEFPLESLELQVSNSDFAVAIGHPDDTILSRGDSAPAIRDNVIFEFGLFMGLLGRKRTFLVEPNSTGHRMPTDLHGLTTLRFDLPHRPSPLAIATALQDVCTDIKSCIRTLGPRS